MSTKSQSSFYHKGKEVISAPSTTRDVGEEAVYSESDHSDEEEMQRALDSECTPYIHPHFPKILGNYALPLPSHVWLALCRHISWASLASSIPYLIIC